MSFKGPKRKRLAKACDACHKSKRRCDGTSPCSNCYFASKECSYTDAAGRPVPAPCLPHPSSTSSTAATASSRQQLPSSTGSSSSQSGRTRRPPPPDVRKRPRVADLDMDGIDGSPSLPPPPLPPPPLVSPAAGPEVDGDGLLAVLDPHVVRELVSLFFAHLYPMRLIFHMPTFFAALASGRIPAYLVHAVCAIAAPIYPDRPQGSAPRNVGTNHAAAARKLMYDPNGVFRAPRDLASVQALCLLQNHEHVAVFPWALSLEYFDLASQILRDDLRVHDPSGGLFPDALSRECARRCAWYIRFMYINHLAYHSVPIPPPEHDTAIPLPADEASFDMAVLNHASPDFLHQTPTAAVAAPPGAVPSELGMVLRISECFYAIGRALDKTTDDPRTLAALENVVADLERRIGAWETALPAGMRYTEDSLRTHKLMYGTAANSSAWSFFFANLTHAGTALGIAFAKRRLGRSMDVSWTRPRLNEIMATLGHLATLNIIAATVIYACDKYASEGTDPRWTYELDVTWGSKFPPVSFEPQARDRTSPSPPESSHGGSPAQASAAPPRSTSSYFRTLSDQFALARAPTTSSASASQTPRAGPPNFSYSLALVDAPADLYASASAPPPAPLSSSSAMRRLQIESFSGSSRAASDAQSVSGQSLPSLKESGLLDCDRPGRGAQLLQPAPPVLGLMAGAGQPPRGLGWLGDGGGGGGGERPASTAVSEPRWRESVWEAGSRC